jgi:hypothetical protein
MTTGQRARHGAHLVQISGILIQSHGIVNRWDPARLANHSLQDHWQVGSIQGVQQELAAVLNPSAARILECSATKRMMSMQHARSLASKAFTAMTLKKHLGLAKHWVNECQGIGRAHHFIAGC